MQLTEQKVIRMKVVARPQADDYGEVPVQAGTRRAFNRLCKDTQLALGLAAITCRIVIINRGNITLEPLVDSRHHRRH